MTLSKQLGRCYILSNKTVLQLDSNESTREWVIPDRSQEIYWANPYDLMGVTTDNSNDDCRRC